MGQFHFDPERYLELMREELPRYDELQEQTAEASRGLEVRETLELGTGTGETARRVLALHPDAHLTGVDSSRQMLERARETLPPGRLRELRTARLQDSLPEGPFDLVFTALAVHHLDAAEKRDLFRRVAAVLQPSGRFVLSDVVVPTDPGNAVAPLSPDFDRPDPLEDQLGWLQDAGFEPHVTWSWRDVAVVQASTVKLSKSRA